ncbi:MAG: helix-turn-helix domain-containing protein [Olsenella sp.]|jgi:excisionase family DNA binding protein|nr:helix-turn-helix domain-containing protein [Olsenella sp.]
MAQQMTTRNAREPELISIREAARMLNVSTRTVNRLCLDGKLKAVRIGYQWRINRRALREYAGLD